MMRNVESLLAKLEGILPNWQLSARPGNDGSPGNTLEDLLEIKENNSRLPDFGEIEVKAKKFEGNSTLLTLFHMEPKPRASVPRLLVRMGWKHEEAGKRYPQDEMSFRSTTYGHRYSDRGFTIEIDNSSIYFVYDPNHVNRDGIDRTNREATYGDWADRIENMNPNYRSLFPIKYDLENVETTMNRKLSHTLMALYESKIEDGKKYFKYREIYLMKEIRFDQLTPLIRDGNFVIDFDARTHHNHGTKFRIKKSKADLLFTSFYQIEM